MTVAELEGRLTVQEFFEWAELFSLEAEQQKKAIREAESKARRRR